MRAVSDMKKRPSPAAREATAKLAVSVSSRRERRSMLRPKGPGGKHPDTAA
jgi:hypothetical protein